MPSGTLWRRAFAGAVDKDRGLLAAEDPQPGAETADAPAGFVGMDDMALTEGLDEQVVRRLGQGGHTLPGPDERARADFQVAVGPKEIADFAVTAAEAVFYLGGHGEHDGAEVVRIRFGTIPAS